MKFRYFTFCKNGLAAPPPTFPHSPGWVNNISIISVSELNKKERDIGVCIIVLVDVDTMEFNHEHTRLERRFNP